MAWVADGTFEMTLSSLEFQDIEKFEHFEWQSGPIMLVATFWQTGYKKKK